MHLPLPFLWQLKTRSLQLGERPLQMGILNVTPDSFSDGGRFYDPAAALDQAMTLLDEGADLLDLGGESTRPSAIPITAEEEQARILPVLRGILHARPDTIVSIDTYHAATAAASIAAGAEIINDVSGLLWDAAMAPLLAREKPGAILMHTRGKPQEWAMLPRLAPEAVMPLVLGGLRHSLDRARQAGIPEETVVLDPGFGFGKIGQENNVLLDHFAELHQLGRPLLAGLSRKRFLTGNQPNPTLEMRCRATFEANQRAVRAGAHLLRIHEVQDLIA